MNVLTKAGVLGVGGAAIAGSYLYSQREISTVKPIQRRIREKLFGTIIPVNETAWDNRANELNTLSDEGFRLMPDLVSLRGRDGKFTKEQVQTWCYRNLDRNYGNDNSRLKVVQRFCTFNNKDKLTGMITGEVRDGSKWTSANDRLKRITVSLSPKMADIQSKLADRKDILGILIGPDHEALQQWCETFYFDTWLGSNQDFLDAQQYCSDSNLTTPQQRV
ncbi:hypothetical protein HF1_14150 [Mycoplasma haemofelis str. Langford 1]|uniref:Uncharacterized protein n=1 Tax=Mycoplasma haemofelis (strain Langford 1) TaxID=941640 RepID=E8ZJV2_MYCHL|nr:hypothetical protein [Mycoplasma haemofelis]CBY93423.1 hypothetical protein HF1_14150 [Mycoplasma haemofelis str. Langford 1]